MRSLAPAGPAAGAMGGSEVAAERIAGSRGWEVVGVRSLAPIRPAVGAMGGSEVAASVAAEPAAGFRTLSAAP